VSFPSIRDFAVQRPGLYELQMGRVIADVVRMFSGYVRDDESNAAVLELAQSFEYWTAGHAVFDELRRRFLAASRKGDGERAAQYVFEEACAQALYNACDPPDPFDSSSPFFVPGSALMLGELLGVQPADLLRVLTSSHRMA
jgi:hypothetical protein